MMTIKIYRDKWGSTWKRDVSEWETYYQLGLIPTIEMSTFDYDIINVYDKKKFLLAVIKHGIEFQTISDNN